MLELLRNSRSEQKRRTVRAATLLDSVAGLSDQAIARAHRMNRNHGDTLHPEMPSLWRAGGLRRITAFRHAASGFGCADCLGSELRLSEAQGVGLCPRVMDVRSTN